MYEYQPIVDALASRPFRPFRMELSNGEMINVTHPEQVWVAETELVVAKPSGNGQGTISGVSFIGLDHVVQLHREMDSAL